MKALGVPNAPSGTWRCEIKYDGYRAVALLRDGSAELWSRNRKNMSDDYPTVIAALKQLRCRSAVLDGEIVALDEAGRSRFQLLQGREISGDRAPLLYYVFDLLQLDGKSLLSSPIEQRRMALETFVKQAQPPVKLSPVFLLQPADLLAEAGKQGLEGIVAKKPGSLYEPGARSGAWVKCKILHEQEFVVGGFTPPRASRQFFGAILVGHYRDGKLLYAGKVGSGFSHQLLKSLHGKFAGRTREKCPFANLPMTRKPRFGEGMTRSQMQQVTWIQPELIAQIKFAEWTHDELLRQPVFLGLRSDKAARDVRREAGAAPRKSPRSRSIRTVRRVGNKLSPVRTM